MKYAWCFVVVGLMWPTLTAWAETPLDFNRDIRPILSTNCFACHGPDDQARKSDLRLDTAEGALTDLGGYRAIEPGQPNLSALINRIESDDPAERMPPPSSGHELTSQQKRLLRDWIDAGGQYGIHWSFVPPKKTALPRVANASWPRHAIDHFTLSQLEDIDLLPAKEANPHHLVRRLSLDLTGLPPTPAEADAFAADPSPNAWATGVDRLLASDAYGEHWARMWLDLARYADTKGYEKDRPREIWRYRDWVIDALNRDLPYDQFTIEQLAGDLLADPSQDQILATAFHRNTMTNEEGGTDDEEFRVAAVKDRVDTTGQVWLGLTVGCAKCHSHKYDPISHRDYYALYAFFNQTADRDRGDESPVLTTPTREQQSRIETLESDIEAASHALKKESTAFKAALAVWRQQFETNPLWRTLSKAGFTSEADVTLDQREDGILIAKGKRPDRDVWVLTMHLPSVSDISALRLDVFPKADAGGDWPDGNVGIREISATLLRPGLKARDLKLTNARADYSQQGWEVARAIDGKNERGWGIGSQTKQRHVALFDFNEPIDIEADAQLRLTLNLQEGGQLLARFRIAVSTYPSALLMPHVDIEAGLAEVFSRTEVPARRAIYQQRDAATQALAKLRASLPKTPIMRKLPPDKRRDTKTHRRGNFLDQGDPVEPGVPTLVGAWPYSAPKNRLGLARWIVQAENPLTARVMVNRVWARLFGTGIVETEEDFGTQGMPPTHQELLDWLAVDFRENGWSLKRLIRTIVLSSTYRQSSATTPRLLTLDPQNRLLSRGPRFRLTAEVVRDQALAVSGLLVHKLGGPSVMPPQPPGIWKSTYSGLKWQSATGPDRYRRGLYTYWKRTSPYPAMITFDAGSGEVCQVRRVRTNTPLQALVTLNDPVYVEAAGALAKQISATPGDIANRISRGFRLVLIRPPDSTEVTRLVVLYRSLQADLPKDSQAAKQLLKEAGLEHGDAALVAVANVLLNLDETLMKP